MASIPELAEMQLDTFRSNGAAHAGEDTALDIDLEDSDEVDESLDAIDVPASIAKAEADASALESVGTVIAAPFFEDTDKYRKYVVQAVDALGLANIGGAEIVAVHARVAKGVANELPKPWGLVRLLALLVYDQKVRDLAGVPLRFNSIHRSLAYNKAIGGASKGQHPACTARDRALVGSGPKASVKALWEIDHALRGKRVSLTPQQQEAINRVRADYSLISPPFGGSVFGEPFNAAAIGWDGTGYVHIGGLGRYNTFVHADCRGVATDWKG